MRHYIYYLLLAVFMFTSCGTTKKAISRQKNIASDSVNIRDSIVIKDSLVISYEVNVRDSVNIKDSTVLVIDQNGKVVSREKYRNIERKRNANKDKNVAQNQSKENVSKTDERHDQENKDQEITTSKKNITSSLGSWMFFIGWTLSVLMVIINLRHFRKKDKE